jgi:tRNA threonylcarbamoyl adenosine modification protein (Sua5/YciO/YrdC/YwlC family)
MIDYVIPGNIDTRVLKRAASALREGAVAALPTETTWITACALNSGIGIKKLRALSGERDERHFTLLCSKISQFSNYCEIDNQRFRLINKYMPGPFVFILKTLHGTEKTLGLKRRELGVRIPEHTVPRALIDTLGEPLYTITAKRSMLKDENQIEYEEDDENELHLIPEAELFESAVEMLDIKGIDLVLDSGEELQRCFSTVIDLTGTNARILRKGAGVFPE